VTGLSRRSLLAAGALAGALGGAFGAAGCSFETGQLLTSGAKLPAPFTIPLRVPRTARPSGREGGADVYRLRAREAEVEILPGYRTRVFGYEGQFPGPTIDVPRGAPIVVEHVNELAVPMAVHLHGGVVPAEADGFPTDLVMPAGHPPLGHSMTDDPQAVVTTGSRRYRYPMDQPGTTLWYHDHRMDFTGPMVYRGLAGFHLVREEDEEGLGLPVGDQELPLMITDRTFDAAGQLAYPSIDPSLMTTPGVRDEAVEGVLGDVVLVNGVPWPVAEVTPRAYRLRLLNASNARRYALRLDPPPAGKDPFVQVGSDGGLLAVPVGHDAVTLSPGERYDVVVDFSRYAPGTRVTLRNALDSGGAGQVLQFRVTGRPSPAWKVPRRLVDVETLDGRKATAHRTFRFRRGSAAQAQGGPTSHWVINGQPFRPDRPVATVRAGSSEVWRFATDLHHPVHVHLAPFQVVGRRGKSHAGGLDTGWKDTLDLRPLEYADVVLRFPRLPGRYLVHCHNLEHEDMMMMARYDVV
jgi:spore coat protein A